MKTIENPIGHETSAPSNGLGARSRRLGSVGASYLARRCCAHQPRGVRVQHLQQRQKQVKVKGIRMDEETLLDVQWLGVDYNCDDLFVGNEQWQAVAQAQLIHLKIGGRPTGRERPGRCRESPAPPRRPSHMWMDTNVEATAVDLPPANCHCCFQQGLVPHQPTRTRQAPTRGFKSNPR